MKSICGNQEGADGRIEESVDFLETTSLFYMKNETKLVKYSAQIYFIRAFTRILYTPYFPQ